VPTYFDSKILRKAYKNMYFMSCVLFILVKYAIIHVPFDFLDLQGQTVGRVQYGSC